MLCKKQKGVSDYDKQSLRSHERNSEVECPQGKDKPAPSGRGGRGD